MTSHVLAVGHCGADALQLARMLAVEADAHMETARTVEDARRRMAAKRYDLVLVNRIIDGDGKHGVDLIAEMSGAATEMAEGRGPAMMLISDDVEAHAVAVSKGAVMGFGKSALGQAEVGQLVRQVLHSSTRAGTPR